MRSKGEKPNGARAGWKQLGSSTKFENEIFRVRQDEVELKGGQKTQYAYVERAEAVVIVPVTADGELVLLNQYRYPVDEWCLEVPAGGMHDEPGASPEEVAAKELREEVGATAKSFTLIGEFYSTSSLTDEKCHVFLAEGVELTKKQQTEESETIEVRLVGIEKALELARSGAIKTGPCALAILMCEPQLQKLGQHRPRPNHLLET
jgi:ADP-ribose pyrophosphatase